MVLYTHATRRLDVERARQHRLPILLGDNKHAAKAFSRQRTQDTLSVQADLGFFILLAR